MFAKLLKHEFRATRGLIGTVALATLAASVMMAVSVNAMESEWLSSDALELVGGLVLIAAMFTMLGSYFAGLYGLMNRFYKSRFTDEGYLTFTLPAGHHALLLSSLLNTLIGMVLLVLIGAAGAAVGVGGIVLGQFSRSFVWADMSFFWEELWAMLKGLDFAYVRMMAAALVTALVTVTANVVHVMMVITLVCLTLRRHRVIAGIGIYYLLQMGLSLVMNGLVYAAVSQTSDLNVALQQAQNSSLMTCAVQLAFGAASYFVMHWLLSRKLNLN